jgi:hypothetical protein
VSVSITSSSDGRLLLTLSSTVVMPFVTLESPTFGRFSRNNLLLLPGQTATVDFEAWDDGKEGKVQPPSPANFVHTLVVRCLNTAGNCLGPVEVVASTANATA